MGLFGKDQGEGFITHAVDQKRFFPTHSFIAVQHGNAIKEVPRLDHESHEKSLERGKGRKEHGHCNKLQGAAKDDHGHQHGIPKGKPHTLHIKSIGCSDKKKSGRNGKCSCQGLPESI